MLTSILGIAGALALFMRFGHKMNDVEIVVAAIAFGVGLGCIACYGP